MPFCMLVKMLVSSTAVKRAPLKVEAKPKAARNCSFALKDTWLLGLAVFQLLMPFCMLVKMLVSSTAVKRAPLKVEAKPKAARNCSLASKDTWLLGLAVFQLLMQFCMLVKMLVSSTDVKRAPLKVEAKPKAARNCSFALKDTWLLGLAVFQLLMPF